MTTKVVGLTGQTGAGKSTVAAAAAAAGCYVINADIAAREAVAKGSECLKALADEFGSDIIDGNGECNRRLLAQRAFASADRTLRLNEITHPWIIRRISEYIEAYRQKVGVILLDAPLLYESGADALCDCVVAVTAPEKIRLERIMQRDSLTEEEATMRIRAQHDAAYYSDRADYIIDGTLPLGEGGSKLTELLADISEKEVQL